MFIDNKGAIHKNKWNNALVILFALNGSSGLSSSKIHVYVGCLDLSPNHHSIALELLLSGNDENIIKIEMEKHQEINRETILIKNK